MVTLFTVVLITNQDVNVKINFFYFDFCVNYATFGLFFSLLDPLFLTHQVTLVSEI
jgi:hypothetical protein